MTESPRESETPSKMHGLWSLISQSPQELPVKAEESDDAETESPRSLFEVMKQASRDQESADDVVNPLKQSDLNDVDVAPLEVDSANEVQTELPVESPFSGISFTERNESRREAILKRQIHQSRVGFVFGLASTGLSVLMLRPEVWMSLPSSITGFTAIILGCLSLTGSQSRDLPRSSKLLAVASISFGIVGIFLGPLVFTRIGREWQNSNSQIVAGRILRLSENSNSSPERPR